MAISVMAIAAEVYSNPLLLEVVELARDADQQTLETVKEYLNNKKEVEHERSSKATARAVS